MNKQPTIKAHTVVQLALTPDVISKAETLVHEMDNVLIALLDECMKGYSLTVQYDSDQQQWSARFAGIRSECVNAGRLLYGNGKSATYALLSLYMKHFLVAKGGVWQSTSQSQADFS